VVAFQQQGVAAAQVGDQVFGDRAGVGQHAELQGAAAELELQGFGGVVRHGERRQAQRAELRCVAIAQEARDTPDVVRNAPTQTPIGRLDEARAARRPVLRWTSPSRSEPL